MVVAAREMTLSARQATQQMDVQQGGGDSHLQVSA